MCSRQAVAGKPYCGKHLTAAARREKRARDEAEAERMRVALETRPDAEAALLEGQWKSSQEMLATLAMEKYEEIRRLRQAAGTDVEGNYGMHDVSEERANSDARGRSLKRKREADQSLLLRKAWEAERDLLKILSASANIDTGEALVKAQVRSRREYANDMREAIAAARSFPDMSDQEVMLMLVREAKRAG